MGQKHEIAAKTHKIRKTGKPANQGVAQGRQTPFAWRSCKAPQKEHPRHFFPAAGDALGGLGQPQPACKNGWPFPV
jgi:hypothetical protein